jgi:DNA repair exonuclease SbcCD nuclease subunit
VHGRQTLAGSPPVVYAGAIERNSMAEIDDKKGIMVVDVNNVSIDFVSMPVRDIINLELVGLDYVRQIDKRKLDGAIVKVDVYCKYDEVYKVSIDDIRDALHKNGAHHCVSINTIPIKSEMRIDAMEGLNDEAMFSEYVDANFGEAEELKRRGLEIMRETG